MEAEECLLNANLLSEPKCAQRLLRTIFAATFVCDSWDIAFFSPILADGATMSRCHLGNVLDSFFSTLRQRNSCSLPNSSLNQSALNVCCKRFLLPRSIRIVRILLSFCRFWQMVPRCHDATWGMSQTPFSPHTLNQSALDVCCEKFLPQRTIWIFLILLSFCWFWQKVPLCHKHVQVLSWA